VELRPLSEQVVVVTGASSGIGLVTAQRAAERGARVVLAARNEQALQLVAESIREKGGQAITVEADVGLEADIARIAEAAVTSYGRFDTWVNNAGVSIFGRTDEVTVADMRRMFDTVYWGVVYGCRQAVAHFKERGGSGAIVNVGSLFGDRSTPVQGTYASAKHAVHGWTEALRMEVEAQKLPISVTLVHPGRIDTPYNEHARSYQEQQPAHRGMIYPPEAVADAILFAAAHRRRDMYVGFQAKFVSVFGNAFPRLTDKVMERYMFWSQRSSRPSRSREDSALFEPGYGLYERGTHEGWIRSRSYYAAAEEHPALVAAGVGAGLAALVGASSRR
jgi:short-subunit dehydrogenase